jgi:peptide/nickel transport system substrate-binding protein
MRVGTGSVTRRAKPTRALVIVAVVGLASAFHVGNATATPRKAAAAATPKPGGSVVYGLEAETAGGWCPSTARLAISGIMVGAAIYDTLTALNSKDKIVPYLAKSVTHDPTYTKWTVTLRDGVKFHDGTPLTADAVAQNVETWRKGVLLSSVFKDVSGVTVDGPLQLTITTAVPWVDFDGFLYFDGRLGIVAPAQLNNPATCNSNLIGTGPFKLDHWTVNQELVALKNPDYWQKDSKGQRLPYLDKITFKPIAEASQRVNSLQGGQVTVMHTSDGQQVDALDGLKGQYNVMRQKPGRREVRYYLMNVAKPPLDDLTARKAVAMAIDRNQINELRNNGVFTIADGPFDSDVMGYVKNTGYPGFNAKQAKKLADQYKAAHGGQFNIVLEHTNDPANTAEAELIKEQLAKAGIDATLKQEDQTAFIASAVGGNFSIMLWRNHPGDDPDVNYVWWQTGSLVNFGKIADPELQSLLDQGRQTEDPAKRKQTYEQVNKIFGKQVYNVWAYYSDWVIASEKNVEGIAGPPLPDGGGQPAFVYGRHPVVGMWLNGSA